MPRFSGHFLYVVLKETASLFLHHLLHNIIPEHKYHQG
jgi:hypothetical protein